MTAIAITADWASELSECTNLTVLEMRHVGFVEEQFSPDLQPICSLRYLHKVLYLWGTSNTIYKSFP